MKTLHPGNGGIVFVDGLSAIGFAPWPIVNLRVDGDLIIAMNKDGDEYVLPDSRRDKNP